MFNNQGFVFIKHDDQNVKGIYQIMANGGSEHSHAAALPDYPFYSTTNANQGLKPGVRTLGGYDRQNCFAIPT
ncbi:MAG: hypothetical protein ACI81P_000183, partial [Neolewinella sp.]